MFTESKHQRLLEHGRTVLERQKDDKQSLFDQTIEFRNLRPMQIARVQTAYPKRLAKMESLAIINDENSRFS